MKYKSAHHGWYRIINLDKYRQPLDETMQSTRPGYVQFKSSLELRAFRYADAHPAVLWWSIEPFFIPYIKPTDGKVHRYFPDLLLNQNGKLLVVEVKSSEEVRAPKQPRKLTPTAARCYNEALKTYYVNQAKWQAAREFCRKKNMYFCILTEKDLK